MPTCNEKTRTGSRDIFERRRPEIGDGEVEPPLDLPVGLFGQADRTGLGDPLQPCSDIDAVAHQVAVALLDDVAEMNADPEDDAAILGHPGVALDHGVLNFDGAAHCVDDAAELDDRAVAGALDDAPVMHGNGRVDQVAAQRSQPRQDAILVGAGKTAVTDNVRANDRRKFPGLAHRVSPPPRILAQVATGCGSFALDGDTAPASQRRE